MGARRELAGAIVAIGCVLAVTLWALHPTLLIANTLTAGGDTGAHVALPWFLRTQLLPHGQLTGWYPGWFDGFPVYSYYFVLSDLLAALGSYVIPYTIAFKLTTVLGSLLLPMCAYALGRGFRLRPPIPGCLAAATLPFLFETSFTIDGGNLFSTLAGEYAFSLSLALSLVAIGLFARGLRTGKGVVVTAVALALTLAAHVLPWLWALLGMAVLLGLDLLPASWRLRDPLPAPGPATRWRTLSFAARAVGLGVALSAWWLLPWATGQAYTISMGYVNDGTPGQPSFAHQLFTHGDRLMLCVALVGLAVAWARRSRFGVWVTTLTVCAGAAYVLDPQGSVWDERLLPFWFFGAWLTCGWLFGVTAASVASRLRQQSAERWIADVHGGSLRRPWRIAIGGWPASASGAMVAGVAAVVLVLPPMVSFVPHGLLTSIGITPGGNEVPNWSAYNYTGYQGVAGWPTFDKDWHEYHAIIRLMQRTGRRDGCGQSMWEYDPAETAFGTTESLMLLPYWTNNCIGSMEGLLFESSGTTPFHFLDQSELSDNPSDPMVGLPYGPSGTPDVTLGLRHLQLLGVRYFLCFSPNVVRATERSHLATLVATIGPFHYGAATRTWRLFVVREAPRVAALSALPVVVPWATSKAAWQSASVSWWLDPRRWGTVLAPSGPSSWPRAVRVTSSVRPPGAPGTGAGATGQAGRPVLTKVTIRYPRREPPPVAVTDVVESVSSISFHVSRTGVPVVVRTSYDPRWHVTGATGPWRVSPNLMVVVPTARAVELTYGGSTATAVGTGVTEAAVLVSLCALAFPLIRRRRAHRPRHLAAR